MIWLLVAVALIGTAAYRGGGVLPLTLMAGGGGALVLSGRPTWFLAVLAFAALLVGAGARTLRNRVAVLGGES